MRARIIAIGQRAAGDDAVGLAVLDRLRRERDREHDGELSHSHAWGGTELHEAADATALIPLLRYPGSVILIDAFVGSDPPGAVRELAVEAIDAEGSAPVSSHALSVRQSIDLARTLYPGEVAPLLRIVGIGIEQPERHGAPLSPSVADAVSRAVDLIAGILERCTAELEGVRPRILESKERNVRRWGS